MRVLVLNSGSSSLKFKILEVPCLERDGGGHRVLMSGGVNGIGAYLPALGGADAVIFGGGIGEQAPAIRARICAGMEWCGLVLDRERNAAATGLAPGEAAMISREDAGLPAYVAAVDEEAWIARETAGCLRSTGGKKKSSARERIGHG